MSDLAHTGGPIRRFLPAPTTGLGIGRCAAFLVGLVWFVPVALAQQVPMEGTEATLDVATWNIEWFGAANGPVNDDLQRANVAEVMAQAGIDLWAVQEISDPADFDSLLEDLGAGFAGVLATESGEQRIGFVYRTDVVSPISVRHILSNFAEGPDNPFAGRAPLQMEAVVALPDTTVRLTFITLHMKCCSEQTSYDRRVEAAQRLKTHLDVLHSHDPVVILGDFNDGLTGSIRAGLPSPYADFLDDTADYFFPTLALEQAGLGTYCNNSTCSSIGSNLDQILVTDELVQALAGAPAERFEAVIDLFRPYASTTSDHLPVLARFRFDAQTATEGEAVPRGLSVSAVYPNPFSDSATVVVTLPRPGPLRVEVFDALGRRVALLTDDLHIAGAHRFTLDAPSLAPGLYLVRAVTDHRTVTQPLLKVSSSL